MKEELALLELTQVATDLAAYVENVLEPRRQSTFKEGGIVAATEIFDIEVTLLRASKGILLAVGDIAGAPPLECLKDCQIPASLGDANAAGT